MTQPRASGLPRSPTSAAPCFAIQDYRVHARTSADRRRSQRLRRRLRIAASRSHPLDFVPWNYTWRRTTAWVAGHAPGVVRVPGTGKAPHGLEPHNYCRIQTADGKPDPRRTAATRSSRAGHGHALQLNYGVSLSAPAGDARRARAHRAPVRRRPLRHGDALRRRRFSGSDLGHLGTEAFWPRAPKRRAARRVPGFLFIAEVCWDLEVDPSAAGLRPRYDKRLYDRLVEVTHPIREHLWRGPRLPGSLGPLSREPRRTASRRRVHARSAIGPQPSSLSSRRVSASSTRASARKARAHPGTSRPRSSRGLEPEIARLSTTALLECLKDPAFRDGELAASRVPCPRGTGTGPGTPSSPSRGPARATGAA